MRKRFDGLRVSRSDRQTDRQSGMTGGPSRLIQRRREFSGTVDHLRPEEDLAAIERSREDERDGGRGRVAWHGWLRSTRQSQQLTEISTGSGRRKKGRRRK